MLKKSIAVAFLSFFVAFPALAGTQTCTVDFPPDAARKTYLIWARHTHYQRCYLVHINHTSDYYTGINPVSIISPKTYTTDWGTSTTFYQFRQSNQYWTHSIQMESLSVQPGHVYFSENCENPELEDGPLLPFTGTLRRVVIVRTRLYDGKTTRHEMGYALSNQIELRPFRPSPGDDRTPLAINCPPPPDDDDDDDECPDLNLTIRGTLLPARRGTARVSGDWCD